MGTVTSMSSWPSGGLQGDVAGPRVWRSCRAARNSLAKLSSAGAEGAAWPFRGEARVLARPPSVGAAGWECEPCLLPGTGLWLASRAWGMGP